MNKYIFQGFVPDKKYNEHIILDNKKIQGHWVTGDLICVDVINPKEPEKSTITYEIFDKTSSGFKDVVDETVCQFTRVFDKYGEPIFSYDIVLFTTTLLGLTKKGTILFVAGGYAVVDDYGNTYYIHELQGRGCTLEKVGHKSIFNTKQDCEC